MSGIISLADPTSSCGDVFRRSYNCASFMFRHELTDNPLFSQASLLELARRLPDTPRHVYCSNGKVRVDEGWDAGSGPRYSLTDTLAGIETNNSLVLLKHVEEDSVIGPLVREIQREVVELAGPQMRDDIIEGRGTLLIASPQRITSFHVDSDVNFLFQIHGDKQFNVFEHGDPTLTTQEELEKYYLGDLNGVAFKSERQNEAHAYDLRAGFGVHVPCLAAHWAQNLDSPSTALSINFDLKSVTAAGRIHRLNGKLRRHGLRPVPPGVSKWRDRLKLLALQAFRVGRRVSQA